MNPLQASLVISSLLFAIGFAAAVGRSNAIIVLLGIELMFNAACMNLISFWRFGHHAQAGEGVLFVLFAIAVAAAETAVGLALIIALYRHQGNVRLQETTRLKG